MRIGSIIEARMSSTRLPGKVLLKVKNKTILDHLVKRIKLVNKINKIIVATTKNETDERIVNWCQKKKINFFRGSEKNVLERVYLTAKKYKLDIIILITGDCPIIDHNLISETLNVFLKNKADYVSNNHIRTYPDGMDVQVFNFKSLKKSYKIARGKLEKEHVTLNIRRNPKLFKPIYVMAPDELHWPELGLTLDELGDYKLIKKIIEIFYKQKNYNFSCKDIVNLIRKKPYLLKLNSNIKRKGDT